MSCCHAGELTHTVLLHPRYVAAVQCLFHGVHTIECLSIVEDELVQKCVARDARIFPVDPPRIRKASAEADEEEEDAKEKEQPQRKEHMLHGPAQPWKCA